MEEQEEELVVLEQLDVAVHVHVLDAAESEYGVTVLDPVLDNAPNSFVHRVDFDESKAWQSVHPDKGLDADFERPGWNEGS